MSGLQHFPSSLPLLTRSLSTWLSSRLWLKSDLCRRLGCDPEQVIFSEHHLSHAASSFLTSPFERAAIITVDGVGEWTTTAIHHGVTDETGTRITPIKELHFPQSIGLLYSALTAYLGFEVNDGEYKVMGLASYGNPRFLDEMRSLCRVEPDGSLELDLRYFAFHRHPERSFSNALEDLLGPARRPDAPLHLPPRSDEDQRFADIAASVQRFTEEYLVVLAREAARVTGETSLCMAGGVALNCVANGRIAADGAFERLFVQPAAGDAGGALGAALWATHVLNDLPRQPKPLSPFLGTAPDATDVHQFLQDCRVPHTRFDRTTDVDVEVAQRLERGEVGGICRGRFEWGPRALGARSIVADARHPGMKERINQKIKFRESFRPFAPAVLDEDASRFFDVENHADRELFPFMLSVAQVSQEGQQLLPSITHIDGSARVQCVRKDAHPSLHGLLSAFKQRTGVGVLLNTSLNLKDEPLCASAVDAYAVFARSDLDFLVLEDCLVTRSNP